MNSLHGSLPLSLRVSLTSSPHNLPQVGGGADRKPYNYIQISLQNSRVAGTQRNECTYNSALGVRLNLFFVRQLGYPCGGPRCRLFLQSLVAASVRPKHNYYDQNITERVRFFFGTPARLGRRDVYVEHKYAARQTNWFS